MRELFVYYRVAKSHTAVLRAAVDDMQAQLRAHHRGLVARVLHRIDADAGSIAIEGSEGGAEAFETWLETYAVDARESGEGVTAAIEAAIEAAAAPLLAHIEGGTRHREGFEA